MFKPFIICDDQIYCFLMSKIGRRVKELVDASEIGFRAIDSDNVSEGSDIVLKD